MSNTLMKAFKSENSGNIIMPKMRMLYSRLFTPGPPSKNNRDPKRYQWGLSGLIPAEADLSVLKKEIDEVWAASTSEKVRAGWTWDDRSYPIKTSSRDKSVVGLGQEIVEAFPHFIRPNAKQFTSDGKLRQKPEVLDPRGQPVKEEDEPDECYNGRWFHCSVQPYFYNVENKGVSLGLVNVQLLGHDKPLAGGKVAATTEFEPIEGLDDLEDGDIGDLM